MVGGDRESRGDEWLYLGKMECGRDVAVMRQIQLIGGRVDLL